MTEAELHRFIGQYRLGALASVGDAGGPQGALVGIASTPRLEIVFETVKSSRKYVNLIARPVCSFVIGWRGEQTVQYEGQARELAPPELEHFREIYFSVWPECVGHLNWAGIVYFVVKPKWIRYSDFDQSPALVEEFRFPD